MKGVLALPAYVVEPLNLPAREGIAELSRVFCSYASLCLRRLRHM